MFKYNYVERKRSEETKRKISESLTGERVGGHEFVVQPKDGKELRDRVRSGDNFKHQHLIDWWRNISSS